MNVTREPVVQLLAGDCGILNDVNLTLVLHLPVIPAVFIVVVLAWRERRTWKKGLLGGHFALVVPANFLNGALHRWSYTAASAVSSSLLLVNFVQTFGFNVPFWAKVFMIYIQGLEIAIQCAPFFICITTRHRQLGGICGLLYILMRVVLDILGIMKYACLVQGKVQQRLIAALVVGALPYVVALVFLLYKSGRQVVQAILTKQFVQDEITEPVDHHATYLRVCLLASMATRQRLRYQDENWKFWRYKFVPGFRFPTRVLCAVAALLTALMQILFLIHVFFVPFMHDYQIYVTDYCNTLGSQLPCQITEVIIRIVIVSMYVAVTVSTFVIIINILLFLRTYRRDMLRMYRGEKSFILTSPAPPQKYLAQNMRFMGYFIAYNILGFTVLYTVVFVFSLLDGVALETVSARGKLGDVFIKLLQIAVFPVTAGILFFIQTFITKIFFLQPRMSPTDVDPPLAVNNRKAYNVATYYFWFVNVAVGIVSILARAALSFIVAIFHLSRLDKNLFPSGWQDKDKGYEAYIGLLQTEYSHNHPAVRVFCHLLLDRNMNSPVKVTSPEYVNIGNIQNDGASVNTPIPQKGKLYAQTTERDHNDSYKRRLCNRWLLSYTLLRNPSLVNHRRQTPVSVNKTMEQEVLHTSVTSKCLSVLPLVAYKISVASPLILTAVMVGIPLLSFIIILS